MYLLPAQRKTKYKLAISVNTEIVLLHYLITNLGEKDLNVSFNLLILAQEFIHFLVSHFHKCVFRSNCS